MPIIHKVIYDNPRYFNGLSFLGGGKGQREICGKMTMIRVVGNLYDIVRQGRFMKFPFFEATLNRVR